MDNVFLAIKAKWPERRKSVYVQQDGAPAHVKDNDMEVIYNGSRYRSNINLQTQAPNSPDFNVLDLRLFRVIQSLTWDRDVRTIPEIVETSKEAFDRLKPRSINGVVAEGGNNFKEPHMRKARLRAAGEDMKSTHAVQKLIIANAKPEKI